MWTRGADGCMRGRGLQAGNQVGESFWRMLLAEHGLDEDGVGHASSLLLVATAAEAGDVRGGSITRARTNSSSLGCVTPV